MIITGMADFESVCKAKLLDWYNNSSYVNFGPNDVRPLTLENVYVVWACKTLQNYKALLSTTVYDDGIYAEFTYNGDKQELYEDIYSKLSNRCHK